MKLVVCLTGASGSIYASRLFFHLTRVLDGVYGDVDSNLRVDWVASAQAPQVWQHELGTQLESAVDGRFRRWDRFDFRAPFASGSNPADAVIVVPCSMSSLARVANGGGDDLTSRACEVALKERKTLLLAVRETPLSLVHLRNMVRATEAGATIVPAIPSFYHGSTHTIEAAVDTVVARLLDHAGLRLPIVPRWSESTSTPLAGSEQT